MFPWYSCQSFAGSSVDHYRLEAGLGSREARAFAFGDLFQRQHSWEGGIWYC